MVAVGDAVHLLALVRLLWLRPSSRLLRSLALSAEGWVGGPGTFTWSLKPQEALPSLFPMVESAKPNVGGKSKPFSHPGVLLKVFALEQQPAGAAAEELWTLDELGAPWQMLGEVL